MLSVPRAVKPGRLRHFAVLALVGTTVASLSACGGSSSAGAAASGAKPLTKINFVFDWIPTSGDVPVLAAQKMGYFAKEGIEVKTTAGGQDVNGATLVAAGQQDIGIVPPTGVMAARANGAPLVSVALTQPTGPTGLICSPESGIKAGDPKTLDGKTIGFSNNANDAIMTKWMTANGVDVNSIKKVAGGFDLTLMIAKKLDCQPNFLTNIPAQVKAHYGKDAVIFKTSDIGAVGQSIVTNEKFLAANPAAVKGFNTAYAMGMKWAIDNEAAAVALIKSSYPSYDEKLAATELPALETFWVNDQDKTKGLLYFDQASLEPTYNVVKGTQWLTKDIDLSKALNTSALPDPAILP
jgi:NitT/TauT family transport system substrate-binding protein